MGYTERFTEQYQLAAVEFPDSAGAGTLNGAWLSMRDFHRAFFMLLVGDIVATGTVDFLLQQATDTAGTGVKAIAGKAITQLTQAGGDSDDACGIELHKRDGLVMVSKLIDGNYPNYHQVIPDKGTKSVTVSKEVIAHAVKRVSILSKEKTNAVKVQLEKNKMLLSTNNPELGEANEDLAVEYGGDDLTIGFNSRYLMDVLAAMENEEITMTFNDPLSPCLITEEGEQNYKCVVMPMRV